MRIAFEFDEGYGNSRFEFESDDIGNREVCMNKFKHFMRLNGFVFPGDCDPEKEDEDVKVGGTD